MEIQMTMLKTGAVAAVLLLAASSFAFVQATSVSPSGNIVSAQNDLTESEVIQKIESAGYTQVKDVQKVESGWTATAVKDGAETEVMVDNDGNIEDPD
jgi:hypothetical protein